MKIRLFIYTLIFISIVGFGPFSFLFNSRWDSPSNTENVVDSIYWIDQAINKIRAQANNLDPKVIKIGITAYLNAKKMGISNKTILTLVDYSKPSSVQRLWVIDLKTLKVLYNTWVSHGKYSGAANATSFSNKFQSLKSSIGVFVTDESYIGGNGYSLRVKGLEPEINDHAYDRNIVFHGASYVSPNFAIHNGRVGRSYGCFAVSHKVIKPLIDTIKNKTLVVAYYPDTKWLTTSKFVKSANP